MTITYINCKCSSFSHTIRVADIDYEPLKPAVVIEVKLNHEIPWYKRILVAIRYVFRLESNEYSETILEREQMQELRDFLNEHICR